MNQDDINKQLDQEERISQKDILERLKSMGYLQSRFERYLTKFSCKGRLGGLAAVFQISLLTGLALTALTTLGKLLAEADYSGKGLDLLYLMLYVGGTYSAALFIALFIPSLVWSGRRINPAGRLRPGSPVKAAVMATVFTATLCAYQMWWWHAVVRSSQDLLPFSFVSLTVFLMIALISLVAGRLLSFTYLLLAGVARQPARRGNHLSRTYIYALIVVVFIQSVWWFGVFQHHNADHTLAEALELYSPSSLPVLLIGLDGVDYQTIEQLSAADSIPNLSRLISEGYVVPLKSRSEYLAPQVWSTVATGVMPEVHGIEGFTRPVPWGMSGSTGIDVGGGGMKALYDHLLPFADMVYRVQDSETSRMTRTLWEINELFGSGSGVVNWWATWPANISSGFTISERTFPKITYFHRQQAINLSNYYQQEVYPAVAFDSLVVFRQELAPQFEAVIKDYPAISSVIDGTEYRQIAELIRSVCFADFFYCMSSLEMSTKHPVGFLSVYFQGADVLDRLEERADNVRPDILAPVIRDYYRYLDFLVGYLVEQFRPNGLLTVVCDPGKKGRRAGNQGMVLFRGLDVGADKRSTEPAELEDIAPTVLFLSGLPVSSNMSGRALVEAGEDGPGGARPLRYVTTFGSPPPRLDLSRP